MTRFWDRYSSWEEAEAAWDADPNAAPSLHASLPPIRVKGLRFKSLWWMITQDTGGTLRRQFFRKPFRYTVNYLFSLCRKKPYTREGDLFFYSLPSIDAFYTELQNPRTHLVVGFSYCQKPTECPDMRFSSACRHDPENPVCRACPIAKAINALPEKRVTYVVIPRVHDIARTLFEVGAAHPAHKILFLISSCELSLVAFGDFANMASFRGIGVRLEGQTCPNFRAFELAEAGIKRGRTHFQNPGRFFQLLRTIRSLTGARGAREE